MVHIKNFKKYYFINEFKYSHLINLDKNISFIWRNKDKETPLNTLIKLRNFCKKNRRNFYIYNDIKLAKQLNADGVYISASNKNFNCKSGALKKQFKILGSAHNIKEIRIKELQNIEEIFLSPLFKEKKNKQLDIHKYLKLRGLTQMKDISLGGINNKNLKKLKMINSYGFAGISFFEQKKGP
tara:strand:+ start:207 stop:755 length:549 start_codon:yes stop_codon:yes gene_type:complete